MMDLAVVYEDNHLLVVNKPAGIPTQSDSSGDLSLLDAAKTWLIETYHKPGNAYLGLVHRLDRPVAGIMVLAKTSKAAGRLSAMIRERSMVKEYTAVTEGGDLPDFRRVHHHLCKDRHRRISRVVSSGHPQARPAVLEYRVMARQAACALLHVHLLTGRSHQIRVQLAALGTPIL
ncbi:RluA family pseudouridine synthase, partial [bacterium]|nr:RluA family pseudouridine synthase [candidate division CSSED10-310 bacterium]